MESIIEDDDQFGSWASEKNLITAAENWGDNLKRFERETRRIYRFFHVLEVLLDSAYARKVLRAYIRPFSLRRESLLMHRASLCL
jgi:hypothetical protein